MVGRELGAVAAARARRAPRAPRARTAPAPRRGSGRRNVSGGDRLAAPVEHHTAPPIAADERAHHLVEPALLEHQPLEPLVDRDAALQHLVLLVHEPRERLLGDRDERQLVGHLEHREAEPRRASVHGASGSCVVRRSRAEAEPGEVVVDRQPHELRAGASAVAAGCRW